MQPPLQVIHRCSTAASDRRPEEVWFHFASGLLLCFRWSKSKMAEQLVLTGSGPNPLPGSAPAGTEQCPPYSPAPMIQRPKFHIWPGTRQGSCSTLTSGGSDRGGGITSLPVMEQRRCVLRPSTTHLYAGCADASGTTMRKREVFTHCAWVPVQHIDTPEFAPKRSHNKVFRSASRFWTSGLCWLGKVASQELSHADAVGSERQTLSTDK